MQGLGIGRLVHYVTASGQHRPAVVTSLPAAAGTVNLRVLLEPSDAEEFAAVDTAFLVDIAFSTLAKPGTWHWPERD